MLFFFFFFFSSRRRHTRSDRDWSSDVCSSDLAEGRSRKAVDLPDLPGEGDDVRGGPDELERARQVQIIQDDSESTVPVDRHERAAVRLRGRTWRSAGNPRALRERVELATAAKFHVDQKAGAGGYFGSRRRLRPERHNLAVLRLVRDRAGLGHVYRVA